MSVESRDLITYVDSNALEWEQTKPTVRQKVLFHNPETGQKTLLVQLLPGYQANPAPPHEWGEYTFVLEGTFVDHNQASPAGTYIHNAPGSTHQPTSPEGCTLLIFVPGSRADEK